MGVAEHVFDVNIHGKLVTWHLFDVGGARGQRHTWVPYFDDANAIIFVAPVSAFDQVRLPSPIFGALFNAYPHTLLPVSGRGSSYESNRRFFTTLHTNMFECPSQERAPLIISQCVLFIAHLHLLMFFKTRPIF